MFKEALKSAIQVVFSIEIAWKRISKGETDVYREFLYPIWTLIVASCFIGGWLISKDSSFELGLKNVIVEVFTLFIGFQISLFFFREYLDKNTDIDQTAKKPAVFVAYSSSLLYLIDIVVALINDFFFLWLFSVYTFYIVYQGAEIYYKVPRIKKNRFMLVVSLLIMGVPLILKYIFSAMITG